MNAGSGKSRNLAEILGNPTRAGPVLAPHNGPGTFPCKCYVLATFIGDRFHILREADVSNCGVADICGSFV